MSNLSNTIINLLPFTFVSLGNGVKEWKTPVNTLSEFLETLSGYVGSISLFDDNTAKILERFRVKILLDFSGFEGYDGKVGQVIQVTDMETGDTELFARHGTYNSWDYDLGNFSVCNDFTVEEVIKKIKRYTFEGSYGQTIHIDLGE